MKHFLLTLLLVLAPLLGVAQSSSVSSALQTVADLTNRTPRLNEIAVVKGRNTPGDWGTDTRSFMAVPFNPLLPIDYVDYFPSRITTNLFWQSTDKDAAVRVVTWGNVKKNGTNDDTSAINYMLAVSAGKTLLFPDGDYRVDGTLQVDYPIRLQGSSRNARLLGSESSTTNVMMDVNTSDFGIENLVFDGASQRPGGVRIQPYKQRITLRDWTLQNFHNRNVAYGQPTMTVGLFISGGTEVLVDHVSITNLAAFGNEVVGDWYGMNRGILISSPFYFTGAAPPAHVTIRDSWINEMPGTEDSDGIVVQGTPDAWKTKFSNVIIDNVHFGNIGKRPVKFSGGGNRMVNCVVTNNFDGAIMSSNYLGTTGYRLTLCALGSAYGSHNEFSGNQYYGSAYNCIVDMASNEVSLVNIIIDRNRVEINPDLPTNSYTDVSGIVSYQSAASHVQVKDNFITARRFGVLTYAPDSDWDISGNHFYNPGGTGTNRTGSGVVVGSSINSYTVSPLARVRVYHNSFQHFGVGVLAFNATNLVVGENFYDDSGTISLSKVTMDQTTTNMLPVTNTVGGSYFGVVAAKRGLFGDEDLDANSLQSVPISSEAFDVELRKRPLKLASFGDWSSGYLRQTNTGQFVYMDDVDSVAWFYGRTSITNPVSEQNQLLWTYPVPCTYGYNFNGYTNGSWYRVASIKLTGFGTGHRYGARIAVGPSGGAAATAQQEFFANLNFGTASIQYIRGYPLDGGGAVSFATDVRVVRDTVNEVAYFDVKASGTSSAQFGVLVTPDVTGPLGYPERYWRAVQYATNVVSLAATESATVILDGLSQKLSAYKDSSGFRETYTSIETNVVVIGNPNSSVNIRGSLLQFNGTNVPLFAVDSGNVYNPDLSDSSEIDPSASGSTVTLSLRNNSIGTNRLTTSAFAALINRANHTGSIDGSVIGSGTIVANRLGTGTPTTNTFLQGQGSGSAAFWGTIPSVPSPTNGIADAPADSVFYGRKNNSWTQPGTNDVSGLVTELGYRPTFDQLASSAVLGNTTLGDAVFTTPSITLANLPADVSSPGAYKFLMLTPGSLTVKPMTASYALGFLDAAPSTHTHTENQVTGLTNDLASKLSITNVIAGTNIVLEQTGQTLKINSSASSGFARRLGWAKFNKVLDASYDVGPYFTNYITDLSYGGVVTGVTGTSDNTNIFFLRAAMSFSGVTDTNYVILTPLLTSLDGSISPGSTYQVSAPRILNSSTTTNGAVLYLESHPEVINAGLGNASRSTNRWYISVMAFD